MTDSLFSSLPPLGDLKPPTLDEVWHARRLKHRRRRVAISACTTVAIAAVALLVATPAILPQSRAKGSEASPDLLVQLAVVGRRGTVAWTGQPVSLQDQVVFRVETGEPGRLRIVEQGASGPRSIIDTAVQAGSFVPSAAGPLGWRADRGPGGYRYHVELCPAPDALCVSRMVEVVWVP